MHNAFNWVMLYVSYFTVILIFLLVIVREANPLVAVPMPKLLTTALVVALGLVTAKRYEMRIRSMKKERHETN
jgi:mannose/fructose/N-acetylgalactosamine-specific phosphotransferase system component IIC